MGYWRSIDGVLEYWSVQRAMAWPFAGKLTQKGHLLIGRLLFVDWADITSTTHVH